ncbi:hypothetical protein A3C20_04800 [Candidatus Kaiserbacteria bacterium RIFCSPHIGHO2_02_FULL_55_25]|uniref:Uncharacterized protein n=1 Tax=Candidatus Kaiserbacteria bacterium RIFCSPHIGHO2_02_FULL_55_25 TaxID=1798498 RepID=A0A1F6EAV0_9BACT|nr:MAG: hypothetical protein A2764_02165 [Candidatus Kaiserbacteria bacterium RIFCSPHIGHO2_01_FULL_55_79]OGG70809.1 MAG: hypothetical protein A3C20_04800 [Candidatus Kaiserbacteria bacterium RIFCSPHIGHO2_02_FULL_55_25]OGG77144.1 MAG: hypothetical protein A3F56_04740 [Candidatus Kaiserbacteria bacterium RIFCSPHIGHO2_12_FULL_55_13]OGG83398.1 MAG: hypothetical protein A3A42_04265 [Candidatus Kaiserbacteria bacterium RIFCSPLOWO2_01_FULL_55_25]
MTGSGERPQPPNIDEILKRAAMDDGWLESIVAPKEKIITPSEVEDAFRYTPLQQGAVLAAEGTVISDATGRAALTLPNHELVAALRAADSRISAFDERLLRRDTHGRLVTQGRSTDVTYNINVSMPLAAQVLQDFPSQESLLGRGIAASINGPVYDGKNLLVRDIRHILRLGDEKGEKGTLLAWVGRDSENVPGLHDRINQFLISGQQGLRTQISPEVARTIFPVLLIYNKSKVKAAGGYFYVLPSDPAEREKCILKAYIAPRPE